MVFMFLGNHIREQPARLRSWRINRCCLFLNMPMIKSTANTTVKTQSSDNTRDVVSGEQAPGETKSVAKRLIRPIWLQGELGWTAVCTAEPREKIMIR